MYKVKFLVRPGENILPIVRMCENTAVAEFNITMNTDGSKLIPMMQVDLVFEYSEIAKQFVKEFEAVQKIQLLKGMDEYYEDDEISEENIIDENPFSKLVKTLYGRTINDKTV